MAERILQLAAAMKQPDGLDAGSGEEKIEVSLPARSAGTLYEKARTAIDYQEEHLLRRNAILRIIRRYMGSDSTVAEISERLLRELIWAKHLENKEVPSRMVQELIPIFEKYEPLLRETDTFDEVWKDKAFKWILEILSTEIEYAVTPPYRAEALVSFMYEEMREHIEWDPQIKVSTEDKDLLIYIAVHKTLLKSNTATLRFRVMTLYYPDWPGPSTAARIQEIEHYLQTVIETVDKQIGHPIVDKLIVQLRRKTGLFHTLRDIIEHDPDDVPRLIEDPSLMDKAVGRFLKKRTTNFRRRLRRTVLRSILFLFITKMLLALILEAPYEFWYLQETNYAPLLINIFFPPTLLALIALTTTIPERKNTKDYQEATRALLIGSDHEYINIRMKASSFSTWNVIFNVIYAFTYLIIYGGITVVLINLHFIWLSIMLFLFFLSLVAFFAIRIRMTTRDIIISNARRGFFGTIFDFFMIPVVRAGSWLSENVSKINVFIYFFDFILEAPIKVAIRFFESWTDYIQEKREEL